MDRIVVKEYVGKWMTTRVVQCKTGVYIAQYEYSREKKLWQNIRLNREYAYVTWDRQTALNAARRCCKRNNPVAKKEAI